MSDRLVIENRMRMRQTFGIRVGPGLDLIDGSFSALSAILQALFACEEFRIKVILLGHLNNGLHIHTTIFHLFKHMVIGKEAFLIPAGILDLFPIDFPTFYDCEPKNLLNGLLQLLYCWYKDLVWKRHLMHPMPSAAQVFLGHFRYKCMDEVCNQNGGNIYANYWITELNITTDQPINIQNEFNQFAKTNYYLNRECCQRCVYEWFKPNALILSLSSQHNVVIIENVLTVQNEDYSLFACISQESGEDDYCCYTKLDEKWYYFKGKIVRQMQSLTELQNVYLLFYQKESSISFKNINRVDKIIRSLEFPSQLENLILFEVQPNYKSLKYTDADLVRKKTHHLMELQALENEIDSIGICYMNATLEALYHCRMFRTYILNCNESWGEFHSCLKHLFEAMKQSNRQLVNYQQIIWYTLYTSRYPLKRKDEVFFTDTFIKLYKENEEFRRNKGINLTICDNIHQFNTNTDYTDNESVLIGREDLTSIDAWMRFIFEKNNSNLYNMFTIQYIECDRCRYGHKYSMDFHHNIYIEIPEYYTTLPSIDSLQKIIKHCSGAQLLIRDKCMLCPDYVNQLYSYYGLCITKTSDILIFKFPQNFYTSEMVLKLHIDAYLTICGQTYQCMAFTTTIIKSEFADFTDPLGHSVTYARTDDHNWWLFDDKEVIKYGEVMPKWNQLKYYLRPDPNEFSNDVPKAYYWRETICLAYYERVIELNESLMKTRDTNDMASQQPSKLRLRNTNGVISYMISVLQCLYNCSEFRNYILYFVVYLNTKPMHFHLYALFQALRNQNYDNQSVDPIEFLRAFKRLHGNYRNLYEYNPKKFFKTIIGDLLKERNDPIDENTNMEINTIIDDAWNRGISTPLAWNSLHNRSNEHIVNMFAIIYDENVYCKTCVHNRISYKAEYMIELELTGEQNVVQTVQSLINAYLLHLPYPTVKCNDCKRTAVKFVSLFRSPNILVILMKIIMNFHIVIERHIQINDTIRINDNLFSFRSCICCNQTNQQSFNYYCYAKCYEELYRFYDSQVSPVIAESFKSIKNVYMLFYEKL